MRRLITVGLLSTVTFLAVHTNAPVKTEALVGMKDCHTINISGPNNTGADCPTAGGAVSRIQAMAKCSGAPNTWHYGNNVYGAGQVSSYTCPGGQTLIQESYNVSFV